MKKKSGEKQIKFERVSDRVNPMGLAKKLQFRVLN